MLVGYCMVQINAADCTLIMHNQLRDLAYSIVREEGSSVVGRSRLLGRDAEDVMEYEVRAQIITVPVTNCGFCFLCRQVTGRG